MPRKTKPERPKTIRQPGTPPLQARPIPRPLPDGTKGFVQPDGRSYWQGRRTDTWETVWKGWATPEEAAHALARLVTHGLPASNRSKGRATVVTVGDLLDHFIASLPDDANMKANTIASYTVSARHVVSSLRDVLITRVDCETLQRYHRCRDSEGASPRTVIAEFRTLSAAWTWGWKRGHVPTRSLPPWEVKVPVGEFRIEHRTPAREEVEVVLDHLRGDVRLAVLIMARTGARVGEVGNLQGQDYDPRTGLLSLHGKTGRRSFPLRQADRALADLLKERTSRGKELALDLTGAPGSAVREALARACKAAKIPHFTPHGIRRMKVDEFIRAGVPTKVAADLLGHSEVIMLRYYASVSDEDRLKAVATLAAAAAARPPAGAVVEGPWPGTSTVQVAGTTTE